MDEGLLSASLEVSKWLRVRDATGDEFVIGLVPASDPLMPRPRLFRWNPAEDLSDIALLVSRAKRLARGYRRWRVQVERGSEVPVPVGDPLASRSEAARFAASYILDHELAVVPSSSR